MADLGVMEMCLLVSDFSPLTERRNACVESNLDRNVGLKFGSTHLHCLSARDANCRAIPFSSLYDPRVPSNVYC